MQIFKVFSSIYKQGHTLEADFEECFGQLLPEEVNGSQVFTIVAASVDAATERIVRFLNEEFGVPINVVFFRYFADNGSTYLARTWLVENEGKQLAASATSRKARTREPWNGSDWYVSFGEYPGGRQWLDGYKYGFVSGGGDDWYSKTLKNLPVGSRVFVHIPKMGYVGVGTVTGEARRFDETEVVVGEESVLLANLPLVGNYRRDGDAEDNIAEWAVPVAWTHALPREEAFWRAGMFANPNTATKLRQQFTIEQVSEAFNLEG